MKTFNAKDEIPLGIRDERSQQTDESAEDESRYAISPISGFTYVKARPGVPMITSEQVREWLADFP
jgi:hypothetical protein